MAHPPRLSSIHQAHGTLIYFITCCVQDRRQVLNNSVCFEVFQAACNAATHWRIHAAVLMPDHFHALISPLHAEASPGEFSNFIKRRIRKAANAEWEWQPGVFDRLLRSDESAQSKWDYIRENPVRAGLVKNWEDWSYRINLDA
jgi:putative transposase